MTASRAKRSAPWADLQPELLGLVLRRLPSLADRVRLRAVCHWWRRVARLEEPLLPPPLPWVALHDATFVSLPAGEIHRMPPPVVADCDHHCHGSVGNWLFLQHKIDGICSLVNPFSKDVVQLPRIDSFARVRSRVMTALFKLVLPSSGHLSPDSLFAVLFSSDGDSTISVGQAATTTTSFWVPRESITDVAFFDGKLYAISRSNKLFVLDIDSSDEDLTNPCGQWRPVNTLGGQALFVGTHSKSLPASECGAQEDCIYFLSDYDWGYYDKDPFRDCGVFNMRNGMITPMSPKIAAMQTQGNKTKTECQGRPAWFFHAEAM
ncbi:hypothetical protein SETIT_3G135600v2 [Setaria italica]|uniref:KIB1-4 beta-propeller domain-containing protein n=1 Tax=Setaria italica TaxID=4555 RepID=A0A368QEN2_SETIT|nr:hypothetical protein SETIT_3G135600v2 [Setaria italica]